MHPKIISIENITDEISYLDVRQAFPERKKNEIQVANEQIGQISIESKLLPGMHLSIVHWQVGKHDLLMKDNGRSDDININLQLKGNLYTCYHSLKNPLDMQTGSHNLISVSEPGGVHQVKAGEQLEMFHLSLQPDHFRRYLDPNEAMGAALLEKLEKKETFAASPHPLNITPAIRAAISDLRNCSLQGHTRMFYQEAKTTELLCLLLDGYAHYSLPMNKLPKREDVEKLYALREYLHRHYLQQNLSLAGLGRESGLNEFTLKKGFKQLFNTTIFGYIQQLRMEHARLLMLESSFTVSEAADAIGYANPQHFSTAYKRHFGVNPGTLTKSVITTNDKKPQAFSYPMRRLLFPD